MDTALSLFVTECTEKLDSIETVLLKLEHHGVDRTLLDELFRAVHTIKGDALVLQRGQIEWFAHIVEDVLGRLRQGELEFTQALASVLLACVDHLRLLINLEELGEADSLDFAEADRTRLIGLLTPYLAEPIKYAGEARQGNSAQHSYWRISVGFLPEVLRRGLDPLYFLQHLKTLGRLVTLRTICDDLPEISLYNPEFCYLRFEVSLDSVADRQAIEDVFSFVADACQLHISPPRNMVQEYLRLIYALPASDLRIGEMLVRIGALTNDELADALRSQRRFDPNTASDHTIGNLLRDTGVVDGEVIDAALQRQEEIRRTTTLVQRSLRVSMTQMQRLAEVLDEAHDSAIRLRAQDGGNHLLASVLAAVEQAQTLTEDMQKQPLSEIFHGLHRFVRDTCEALGKQADLFTRGGELEVERTLTEPLRELLIHLLRNALDHGLEAPALRLAAGKPARGCLHIDAWEEGDNLLLSVSDDGAGVDRSRVLARAQAQGLLAPGERIGDEDLFALLRAPGFSTADKVSQLSGRGVGLDVVHRSIQALGGQIRMSSLPARGARFELRLPRPSRDFEDSELAMSARRNSRHG